MSMRSITNTMNGIFFFLSNFFRYFINFIQRKYKCFCCFVVGVVSWLEISRRAHLRALLGRCCRRHKWAHRIDTGQQLHKSKHWLCIILHYASTSKEETDTSIYLPMVLISVKITKCTCAKKRGEKMQNSYTDSICTLTIQRERRYATCLCLTQTVSFSLIFSLIQHTLIQHTTK